jgi:hypothetical protein
MIMAVSAPIKTTRHGRERKAKAVLVNMTFHSLRRSESIIYVTDDPTDNSFEYFTLLPVLVLFIRTPKVTFI